MLAEMVALLGRREEKDQVGVRRRVHPEATVGHVAVGVAAERNTAG